MMKKDDIIGMTGGIVTVALVAAGSFIVKKGSEKKTRRSQIMKELKEIKEVMKTKHWMSNEFKEAVYRQQQLMDELLTL
ncbi:MAG: hypothetical protein J6I84_03590 [Bacilli bacterium]|nr:hypothetical protein [Bacilli bacterium]